LGKLRVLSGEQVCAILAHHGFMAVRQRGSHIVMQKHLSDTTVTVPVPNHTELRIGTLQSHFQNVSVWSRSRRVKILTEGIHGVFRGLKFSPNAEIGQNGTF